jgi:hypothetical protein
MQGHRKRRREPVLSIKRPARLSWTEYKAVRQYYAFGDLLDSIRLYGVSAGIEAEMNLEMDPVASTRNGHFWLTKDPA